MSIVTTNKSKSTNKSFRDWVLQNKRNSHDHDSSSILMMPPILLLDGGVSTYLESHLQTQKQTQNELDHNQNHNHNQIQHREEQHEHVFAHRELWSSSLLLTSSGQDAIQACHSAFLQSGSDIISSVTYQAHYLICQSEQKKKEFPPEKMDQMLRDGIRLAKCASDGVGAGAVIKDDISPKTRLFAFVAASIGCYGGALADGSEYTGNYGISLDELKQFHKRKIIVLSKESPDALAFETIPCAIECTAIIHLLKELQNPSKDNLPPIWLSLACCDETHLNDGTLLKDALDIIDENDINCEFIDGIGINCCSGDYVPSLLEIITQHMAMTNKKRFIVFYPNNGEEWNAETQDWVPHTGCTSSDAFADMVMNGINVIHDTWRQYGGEKDLSPPQIIVGGCCRTTPETISSLRKRIDKMLNTFQS